MGLKARLLAAIIVLLSAFCLINIAKNIWVQPPELIPRIAVNLVLLITALICLRVLFKGQMERAGNALAIAMVLAVNATSLIIGSTSAPVAPLSVGIQIFAYDLIFLLFAIIFAARRVATVLLVVILVGQVSFSMLVLRNAHLSTSAQFSADTLLREGLIVTGLLFCLGITLMRMIESAYRRSEESLRETRTVNENLERLVSERTRELEAASQHAAAASRAKSDFLANMSHEIRTPLNGIVASSDLLIRRSDLSPEARDHAQLISESGDLLLKLLGDILDFSKIEAGQVVLEHNTFELDAVVADAVALMANRATAGSVSLDFSIAPELPSYLEGDSHRLRQVLLNLVANAVKFTPASGRVQVIVTSAPRDPASSNAAVRFEVRDTGIGLDDDAIARLFERFMQADTSTTRRYGGSGLGLAISFRLVQIMGGQLEVTSAPGQGASFFFTLPFKPIEMAPDAPAELAKLETKLNLRVLVAEDNAVNRKIIATQLTQLGCSFTMAVDGQAALVALQTQDAPDIVLMDCHMPQLDGWETTRRIRQWSESPDDALRSIAAIPVVALTAAAYPEERIRCREAGMNDFIAKPVKLAELQQILLPFARRSGQSS